ncbi:iron complex transport system substrate-binding protein [Paenibacillus sp. UNCCL117]|uniref:AraC family transcriptional regulator n=1 Tax=unclassified Paenibacillus TaxID=185978 RepID=UPI000885BAC0|nr:MULTISPECIES: AraC family transcriptional regulator [unclassified Paenibacillus]SDD26546.1 iron complex transport system substrate-binding protein [Paenibacillus sp. cl123]SFW41070.1 iron complex transport system substrate-binding protein [Paenibacillus sp. UNCCL117]
MDNDFNIDEQARLWAYASHKVLDVRLGTLLPRETLLSYRLPASAFLFAVNGEARISLDGTEYAAKKFHVLHAGKGFCLDIAAEKERFEYYLIFYKAVLPPVRVPELHRLMERCNPFQSQFGFAPRHPLSLFRQLELMDRDWHRQAGLERLHVKALFHQFIYELMRQLHEQKVPLVKADAAAQAIRYIHEHYAEPLTLEELARLLDSSPRHLSRMFKSRTGCSPIDYLIRHRIDKAKEMLLCTDASLLQIAAEVGFQDRYYFSRMFKKFTGITPVQYKQQNAHEQDRPYPPSVMARSSIAVRRVRPYTVDEDDNHYQQKCEGASTMKSRTTSFTVLTLLLSLTLLLGACGTNSGATQESQPPAGQQAAEPAAAERVLKDGLGHEVKVPAKPQRIIASYLEDHLVALGVKPVAQWSVKQSNVQFYLQDALKDVPLIPSDLPFEVVTSFQPDLLLIDSAETVAGDKYAQYAKIAPTYTVGMDKNNDWRQELLEIGKVLNKSAEAKQALDTYEAKVKEAKEKLQKAIGTKSAVAVWHSKKNFYVVNEKMSSGDVLYKDLGFTVPAVVKEITSTSNNNWNAISLEKLAEMDVDYIFLVNSNGKDASEELQRPLWKNIPAVKNGQIYEFGLEKSWLYTGTIANTQMIDDVLKSVIK